MYYFNIKQKKQCTLGSLKKRIMLLIENDSSGLIPCFYFTVLNVIPLTVVDSACVFACF